MQRRFKYYETPQFDGRWRALPGFKSKRRVIIQSREQAIETLKADDFQVKNRMLGGVTVTLADGVTTQNLTEAELMRLAQTVSDQNAA